VLQTIANGRRPWFYDCPLWSSMYCRHSISSGRRPWFSDRSLWSAGMCCRELLVAVGRGFMIALVECSMYCRHSISYGRRPWFSDCSLWSAGMCCRQLLVAVGRGFLIAPCGAVCVADIFCKWGDVNPAPSWHRKNFRGHFYPKYLHVPCEKRK
jgi:hypothetical protein